MIQKILYIKGISLYCLLQISQVFAQEATVLPTEGEAAECIKTGDCHLYQIPLLILHISNYLVGIAGTISVLMFMVGGYQFIMGGMNENMKGKGKKTLGYAIGGFVVTLFSWLIVNLIQINLLSK